jgi:hypothetical protein
MNGVLPLKNIFCCADDKFFSKLYAQGVSGIEHDYTGNDG